MNSDLEALVSAYIEIRNERERILHKFDEEDAALKKDLVQLEVALLDVCNNISANSINTQYGTVIRKLNERFYCNDWDNFRKFVRENDAVELLERRIHQGNFKQFLAEHKEEGLPPGVNVMREFGVTVRKSNSSTQ